MGNLLYLVHRLPYPPNKGDKLGSYHLLKHLQAHHRVFLGTFVDDPADEVFVDTVREICPDFFVARLDRRSAKLRSLGGLLTGEALSVGFYRNSAMQAWVSKTLTEHHFDAAVIFSGVMAQYVYRKSASPLPPIVINFADVDSAKWTQYASQHRWPMSWLYRREGERLLSFERAVAARARCSLFVTASEAALFCQLAPECSDRVEVMCNGVDSNFFAPNPAVVSPFTPSEIPLVFTGAMDYWPNIDAVTWFAQNALPALRQARPQLRFYIVGRAPPPSVLALAGEGVVVTGTVPDVRPYLQHAAVVVAPLRIARGIQNKVLEAMAMARPVVAARSCVQAIDAKAGEELVPAETPEDYVREVDSLLQSAQRAAAVGQAGRLRVLQSYSWDAHLSRIDRHLNAKACA